MNTYYIFNIEKLPLAEQLFQSGHSGGFFDFKVLQKKVRGTSIPLSNTQLTDLIFETRQVLVLETDFSSDDAALRQAAEAQSEFFSQDNLAVITYLNTLEDE